MASKFVIAGKNVRWKQQLRLPVDSKLHLFHIAIVYTVLHLQLHLFASY